MAGSHRLIWLFALVLIGNVGAWAWAKALFGANLVLMGTASLAYLLGLRHAVDADHIAAIDNVSRKLLQQGRDPAAAGFYFSLGHSTVVAIACAVAARLSVMLQADFRALGAVGRLAGAGISATFLFLIAMANLLTLVSVWHAYKRRDYREDAMTAGLLGKLLRPFVAIISSPAQMYPLGFLFGLGFDTASEVGLLGVSAGQTSAPFWTVMVFPALFTAGMSLVDTMDGLLMKVVYGWALVKPGRKLGYNLAVTLFSVIVAMGVGLVEVLGLIAERFRLASPFWSGVSKLSEHSSAVGCLVIAGFLGAWLFCVRRLNARRGERNHNKSWSSLFFGLLGMSPPKKPFLP